MFTGSFGVEHYGKLLRWRDHPDAHKWLMTRRGLSPGNGLLVLEAQERVMSFLVRFTERILHDLTKDSILRSPTQEMPEIPSDSDAGFASSAVMAAEAPYQLPAVLNFDRIATILTARYDAAADHLLSLREDPSYFEACHLEWKEHSLGTFDCSAGRSSPTPPPTRKYEVQGFGIFHAITLAYLQVEIYSKIKDQARILHNLQSLHAEDVKPELDLPTPYMSAIQHFHWCLSLVATPLLIRYLVHAFRSTLRPNFQLDNHQIRLVRMFGELSDPRMNLNVPDLVAEVQYAVNSRASVRDLVSPYVMSLIGELAFVCECRHRLNTYQPWASSYHVFRRENKAPLFAEGQKVQDALKSVMGDMEISSIDLSMMHALTEGQFSYPIGKRRTRENVEALRTAEENLDTFWLFIDQLMELKGGRLADLAVGRLLAQPRALQRTDAWVEPVKDQPMAQAESLCMPLSQLYLDLERRTEQTLAPGQSKIESKTKNKTRGIAKESGPVDEAQDNAHDHLEHTTAEHLQFGVDKRALKTLNTIFFTPSISATPGELAWTDFLHAMASVGFTPEKLYGSVWQFSPKSNSSGLNRSIQFHEPHPASKIPYRVTRRYGRRLNRAYGWHGGMFVLERKGGQEYDLPELLPQKFVGELRPLG